MTDGDGNECGRCEALLCGTCLRAAAAGVPHAPGLCLYCTGIVYEEAALCLAAAVALLLPIVEQPLDPPAEQRRQQARDAGLAALAIWKRVCADVPRAGT